ncbi:hypothetical protein FGL86_16105 [Pistricoccus aurantiacus]|uniref:Uncharacterized protein n=2 Tax=Pistricoccus aurantiacus TaxID=1883414 RepID=A0A5B8T1Q9_9GAMM|nr:hypothetical protein FGL86_16105 [Pistricoccus aurantiacus]
MSIEGVFNWIGTKIGEAIRFIIDLLTLMFSNLDDSLSSFIYGVTDAMGINASLFSMIVLVIGLVFLYRGVRALLRRGFIAGLLWLFGALLILGWLVG